MIDLRCGDWREVLADVDEVDALICDPPYSTRTHTGHSRVKGSDGALRRTNIGYDSIDSAGIREFVSHWSKRTRGWICIHTSHDLGPQWETALAEHGRYVFPPIPCVVPGMASRLTGDGPSSWTCWLIVARPRSREFSTWGTLQGAYVGRKAACDMGMQRTIVMGQKPVWMISAIIRDYSRPGDLVCDPFSGGATTAIACSSLGRRFVGSEIDPETYAKAQKRLAGGQQIDLFGGAA